MNPDRKVYCPNPECNRFIRYSNGKTDKMFWCPICGSEIQSKVSESELLLLDKKKVKDFYDRECLVYGDRATTYAKGIIDKVSIRNREKALR